MFQVNFELFFKLTPSVSPDTHYMSKTLSSYWRDLPSFISLQMKLKADEIAKVIDPQ